MFNHVYHWGLRKLHMLHTITYQIQLLQRAEPLVFLLLAFTAGIFMARSFNTERLIFGGGGLGVGILAGHLFWGGKAKK